MTTFKDMRKNQKAIMDRLSAESEKLQKKGFKKDDRLWYPELDKSGNGFAIIRFLPAPAKEEMPWVRVFHHGFQGPSGKWYVENCLSTIDQDDPVLEYNSKLWKSGSEKLKKQASAQKRKTNYYVNIVVLKDSLNPENEGKVFIYRFGPKIWDKVYAAMHPSEAEIAAGVKPFNPFDLEKGANFRVKITLNADKQRDYAQSCFDPPSPAFDGDEDKMEEVWKQTYPLASGNEWNKFKSREELKERLELVLELNKADEPPFNLPVNEGLKEAPVTRTRKAAKQPEVDEEDVDDEALLNSLANDLEEEAAF